MLYLFFFLSDSLQLVVGNAAHTWHGSDPQACLCLTVVAVCRDQDLPQTNTHPKTLPSEVLQICECSTCPQYLACSSRKLHSSSVATICAEKKITIYKWFGVGKTQVGSSRGYNLFQIYSSPKGDLGEFPFWIMIIYLRNYSKNPNRNALSVKNKSCQVLR